MTVEVLPSAAYTLVTKPTYNVTSIHDKINKHRYTLQVILLLCSMLGLSIVLRLCQHNIGYTANGFYRSDDPTNSVKALKEGG